MWCTGGVSRASVSTGAQGLQLMAILALQPRGWVKLKVLVHYYKHFFLGLFFLFVCFLFFLHLSYSMVWFPRRKGGVLPCIGIRLGYICVGLRCLLADGAGADGMAITYGKECLIPPSGSAMLFSIWGVRSALTYHLAFLVPAISGQTNL